MFSFISPKFADYHEIFFKNFEYQFGHRIRGKMYKSYPQNNNNYNNRGRGRSFPQQQNFQKSSFPPGFLQYKQQEKEYWFPGINKSFTWPEITKIIQDHQICQEKERKIEEEKKELEKQKQEDIKMARHAEILAKIVEKSLNGQKSEKNEKSGGKTSKKKKMEIQKKKEETSSEEELSSSSSEEETKKRKLPKEKNSKPRNEIDKPRKFSKNEKNEDFEAYYQARRKEEQEQQLLKAEEFYNEFQENKKIEREENLIKKKSKFSSIFDEIDGKAPEKEEIEIFSSDDEKDQPNSAQTIDKLKEEIKMLTGNSNRNKGKKLELIMEAHGINDLKLKKKNPTFEEKLQALTKEILTQGGLNKAALEACKL